MQLADGLRDEILQHAKAEDPRGVLRPDRVLSKAGSVTFRARTSLKRLMSTLFSAAGTP